MKRFASMILVMVLILTMFPVVVPAAAAEVELYGMRDLEPGEKYKEMASSQELIDIIKDFEGFSATPYKDNTQWTVGYGSYCGDSDDPKPNIRLTEQEAEKRLRKDLSKTYEPIVNRYCKSIGKQPTQNQFDALVDLTYNLGGSWTTGKAVTSVLEEPADALSIVKGFGAYSRTGGKVSYVHVNRRIREALMYIYGEYYRAYGNQDCVSDIEVVDNDNLPRYKVMIFKSGKGEFSAGRTDYADYYEEGEYFESFPEPTREGYTLVGWKITKRSNDTVKNGERVSIWDTAEENLELTAIWEKGVFEVEPEEPPVDYEDPEAPEEPEAPAEPEIPEEQPEAPTEPEVPETPSEPETPTEPEAPEMEPLPDVEVDMDRLPFVDVSEDSWYWDAVNYVYRNSFMNGTSSTTFDPDGAMTRGMVVTVLYRMDGAQPVTDEERACFDDIADSYYTDAVAWAYSNGIVNGVSETSFAPNNIITRQEAITIFYRYCVDYNLMRVDSVAGLEGFLDHGQVADFAVDAFSWAVAVGLVNGSATDDGVALDPVSDLNRAQAAALLQRCVQDILN